METESFKQTDRTTLKRLPQRGSYDRETVYKILDEGLICYVGFVVNGSPFVIPTGYGRAGDKLYIHGSAASRMLRSIKDGIDICINITLIDGLVLARSAFHHSMNYRSVVIMGKAYPVEESEEKMEALRVFTEHIVPGRWDEVRKPNEQEMKGTLALSIPLMEASAKVRTGPPLDDEADKDWPVWAGVVPLTLTAGEPIDDSHIVCEMEPPEYALDYNDRRWGRSALMPILK